MKSLSLKLSLLILILLPGSFSKIFAGTESLKEGLLVASAMASFVIMVCGQKINKSDARKMLMRFACLVIFLMVHGALTIYGANFNTSRFFLSLSFLTFVFILWVPIIESIEKARSSDLDVALCLCYWVLLADGLLSTVLYMLAGSKTMFFSSEPSHFALAFLPFLSYMLFRDGSPLHFAGALFVSIFINNLTLLIGVVLLVIFHYRHRFVFLMATFTLMLLASILSPGYGDYVLGRLTLSADTDNLTALVFMSGYERAYVTLVQENILGVGFQQMGFVGPSGELIDAISRVTNGYEANLHDGGTLASKLIVEFGLFGVAALVLYLLGLKNIFASGNQLNATPRARFFASIYITFICYAFVRGLGYMSPSVFLFIFAAFMRTRFSEIFIKTRVRDFKFSRARISS